MKKIIFSSLFLFSCVAVGWGQYYRPLEIKGVEDYEAPDSAYLQFTYRLISVKDTAQPQLTCEDRQVLQIGKKYSKYFSQYLVDYSEKVARDIKNGKIKQGIEANPYSGCYGYEIFKNYPRPGILTYNDIGCFVQFNYTYEEELPVFNWKMEPGQDTVLGYVCRKATTRFRGRNYTAWFTMQIPISNGPWKFGGLPGLILKIADARREYVWECIGMEQSEEQEPIRFYRIPFSKITRKNLAKLYQRFHQDEAAFNNRIGMINLQVNEDGSTEEFSNSKKELPYNPIELE